MKTTKIRNLIALGFTCALISSCAGDGVDRQTTATAIVPGEIKVTTATTRVDHLDTPGEWAAGDILAVSMDGRSTTFRYSKSDDWQYATGSILYMEDYMQNDVFAAVYGPTGDDDYADQRTKDKYLAQTRLAGDLTLSGNKLNGNVSHQMVDLVVTIKRGNGWKDNAYTTALTTFKYLTTGDPTEVMPYAITIEEESATTFRAQLHPAHVPASDNELLVLNGLKATYTVPHALVAGQRLTLTLTYHQSGNLVGGEATVSDFTDIDPIDIPGNLYPTGYDYIVYDWKTLVYALSEVQDGGSIIQIADITCPGVAHAPKDLPSDALYNGNGHSITGLKAALFEAVHGYVYNLHLHESAVTTTGAFTGLLANVNWDGIITLCSAAGRLEQTAGGEAGGLVGYNFPGSSITRSYTNVQVTANSAADWVHAGGLVGANEGNITACAAFGAVTNETANASVVIGTLVGGNNGDVSYAYAIVDAPEIGDGTGTTVNNSDATTVPTLVIVPTTPTTDPGIASSWRTFNGAVDGWWMKDGNNYINYQYEGKK